MTCECEKLRQGRASQLLSRRGISPNERPDDSPLGKKIYRRTKEIFERFFPLLLEMAQAAQGEAMETKGRVLAVRGVVPRVPKGRSRGALRGPRVMIQPITFIVALIVDAPLARPFSLRAIALSLSSAATSWRW